MTFGSQRGFSSPRDWSVNTWLIVICIAVFVLNSLMPPSLIMTGEVEYFSEDARQIPKSELAIGVKSDGKRRPFWSTAELPVLWESPDGIIPVGTQEVVVQGFLLKWGYFSTAKALVSYSPTWGLTGFEFWRFITFQFLHANLTHLLFNMIGLFFFGSIVEQFLGKKRYLAFYLLCGIAGACMYLLLNSLGMVVKELTDKEWVPFLLFDDKHTILVGASAGVFGVIMAAAFLMPEVKVLLFFVIPMKLKTLAYGLVAVALLSVFFSKQVANAGGEAAHIGGAVAGFFFVRKPHFLHGFFDFLGRVDPTSRSNKARKAGMVRSSTSAAASRAKVSNVEIDRILEKIHDKGLQSLTEKEKKILREASRR